MTAKDIQWYLEHNYFKQSCKFIIPNIYYFGSGHESDLLVIKPNNLAYEIEIKISRADFFNDFKKPDRHQVIEHGFYLSKHKISSKDLDGNRIWIEPKNPVSCSRANRFYFAVPENLIKVEELPHYAGLFYIYENGRVEKVKEAKLLHKEKITDFEKLANKCYWMWKSQKPLLKNPNEN